MRLFLGVHIPEEIQSELLLFIKGHQFSGGIRWSSSENLHLTLKFLGEVSPEKSQMVMARMREVSRRAHPLSLELASGGIFPNQKNPKIFWVGVEEKNHQLKNLVQLVESELQPLGFPKEEKPFVPHLTVGRLKKDIPPRKFMTSAGQFCKLLASYRSPKFMVKEFHLIQSHLFQGGVRYEVKNSFQLRAS